MRRSLNHLWKNIHRRAYLKTWSVLVCLDVGTSLHILALKNSYFRNVSATYTARELPLPDLILTKFVIARSSTKDKKYSQTNFYYTYSQTRVFLFGDTCEPTCVWASVYTEPYSPVCWRFKAVPNAWLTLIYIAQFWTRKHIWDPTAFVNYWRICGYAKWQKYWN